MEEFFNKEITMNSKQIRNTITSNTTEDESINNLYTIDELNQIEQTHKADTPNQVDFSEYPITAKKYMSASFPDNFIFSEYSSQALGFFKTPFEDVGDKQPSSITKRLLKCSSEVLVPTEKGSKASTHLCGLTHLCPVCRGLNAKEKQNKVATILDNIDLKGKKLLRFRFTSKSSELEGLKHVSDIYNRLVNLIHSTYTSDFIDDFNDDNNGSTTKPDIGSISEFGWKMNVNSLGARMFDSSMDVFCFTSDIETMPLEEHIISLLGDIMIKFHFSSDIVVSSLVDEISDDNIVNSASEGLLSLPRLRDLHKVRDSHLSSEKSLISFLEWMRLYHQVMSEPKFFQGGFQSENGDRHSIETFFSETELDTSVQGEVFQRPEFDILKQQIN